MCDAGIVRCVPGLCMCVTCCLANGQRIAPIRVIGVRLMADVVVLMRSVNRLRVDWCSANVQLGSRLTANGTG